MQASCVALSESRRLFLRYLSLVDRRSRLNNRVSSSTALSEARRIFLQYLSLSSVRVYMQFYARVVVELELRYVQRPLLASGSEPT